MFKGDWIRLPNTRSKLSLSERADVLTLLTAMYPEGYPNIVVSSLLSLSDFTLEFKEDSIDFKRPNGSIIVSYPKPLSEVLKNFPYKRSVSLPEFDVVFPVRITSKSIKLNNEDYEIEPQIEFKDDLPRDGYLLMRLTENGEGQTYLIYPKGTQIEVTSIENVSPYESLMEEVLDKMTGFKFFELRSAIYYGFLVPQLVGSFPLLRRVLNAERLKFHYSGDILVFEYPYEGQSFETSFENLIKGEI